MAQFGWPLLSFLFVIACIPAALWLLRRTPMGSSASRQVARTVGVTPVGPQERIVTVEVGQGDQRQWLVLGVTTHGISTLHTMAPQPEDLRERQVAADASLPAWLQRLKAGVAHARS